MTCLREQFLSLKMLSSWVTCVGVHSLVDGSRIRISLVAGEDVVSLLERPVHARESFSQ